MFLPADASCPLKFDKIEHHLCWGGEGALSPRRQPTRLREAARDPAVIPLMSNVSRLVSSRLATDAPSTNCRGKIPIPTRFDR